MPATKKFKMEGHAEMERNLLGIARDFRDDAGNALKAAGEAVLALSVRVYVPVDLGPLRASAQTAGPEYNRNTIIVVIAFGSPTVDYAIVQHEEPDFEHTVGEWKYLETPLFAAASSLGANLARELQL